MFQLIGTYPDYGIPRLLQTTNDRIQTTETLPIAMQYAFLKDLCEVYLPKVPKTVIMGLIGVFLTMCWIIDVLDVSKSYYCLLVGAALISLPILNCIKWESCRKAVEDEPPTGVFVTDCMPRTINVLTSLPQAYPAQACISSTYF